MTSETILCETTRTQTILGRMITEPVVGTRGDGAVDLYKHGGRNPMPRLSAFDLGFHQTKSCLHGIEQNTVEVLIVGPNILYTETVNSSHTSKHRRDYLPYQTKYALHLSSALHVYWHLNGPYGSLLCVKLMTCGSCYQQPIHCSPSNQTFLCTQNLHAVPRQNDCRTSPVRWCTRSSYWRPASPRYNR